MADPLLNTLCTICHTNSPKYVCPGCSAQTCSLPCTQKHKAWANCNGRRDPTAYMPASRLKTAAGIDHDYNFLSAIERERDRNQRDMVEDKRLFTEREVRQMDDESRFRKLWFGENVRFDPIRGSPRTFGEDGEGAGGSGGDDDGEGGASVPARASYLTRQVRMRLDQACIQVVQMPMGMTRQRENTTSWNRKSRNINWCVEWMVYDNGAGGECKTHTRIRHKALETVPVYKALGNSVAWYRKGQQKEEQEEDEEEEESAYARKRRRVLIKEVKEEGRRSAMQDEHSTTWVATPYPAQNPYTGSWGLDRGASVTSWLPDEEVDARRGHRFYLLKPLTPVGKPKELIPVESTETLSSALRGRTVLEYPTIYILPPPSSPSTSTPVLPEGFILGSTERRERPKRNKAAKRKAADKNEKSSQPPNKRLATTNTDGDVAGIPMRPSNNHRGRGGGARGGRGARFQQQQHQHQHQHQQARGSNNQRPPQDAEEGEINSDGDEVPRPRAEPADTSSSDPDTSSDEEEAEEKGPFALNSPIDDVSMRIDGVEEKTKSSSSSSAAAVVGGGETKSGLGLVEYGSDSDGSDEEGDEDEDDEGVDLAGLKPENPELVANAIKEIVGLLSS
ncbi:Box C/D snoRNA protein 1 [Cytospora mali]|uniref:Box C/D snoRNA protein 1 n=1 Tax=Cytospora mali TaxID=578113 RepID=A0A194VU07_CYTMA|nr:Box C/D snoRNA protein 1 [Valsa mali]